VKWLKRLKEHVKNPMWLLLRAHAVYKDMKEMLYKYILGCERPPSNKGEGKVHRDPLIKNHDPTGDCYWVGEHPKMYV